MTGIGRATHRGITGEIRSSNHRYLEIVLRLPPELEGISEELKEIVRRYCHRGFFTVTVHLEEKYLPLTINTERLKKYLSLLKEIKEKFCLSGEISLSDLFTLPGVFAIDRKAKNALEQTAKEVLTLACQRLCLMRREEGGNLLKDFHQQLKKLNTAIKEIKKRIPGRLKEKKAALIKKSKELPHPIPENRIQEEIAILAGRTDISEELTRLLSHLRLFSAALKKEKTSGRKLEFILQEMLRESETLSAKARDFFIAKKVIEIKEVIERMREQAKNVE